MFSRIFTIIFTLFIFISCSSDDTISDEKRELNRARQKWNATQILNYSINERKGCFCPGPYTWGIFVKNGIKEKVEYDETQAGGQTYDDIFDQARTVEDAFDFIEILLGRDLASLNVEYDEVYGFPKVIGVDYIKDAVDDEIGYIYSDFEITN